jgi:hypothetical protein
MADDDKTELTEQRITVVLRFNWSGPEKFPRGAFSILQRMLDKALAAGRHEVGGDPVVVDMRDGDWILEHPDTIREK